MSGSKLLAVLEVCLVFALVMAGLAAIRLSPLAAWEDRVLGRFFLEYTWMIAIPLLILLVARRSFQAYGLTLNNFRRNLDLGLACFLPFAAAFALQFALPLRSRLAAELVSSALGILVLFAFARILGRMPAWGGLAFTGLLATTLIAPAAGFSPAKALSAAIFYIFFLGPGEEILFRGYIQTRLDEALSLPRSFYGAAWGGGTLLMALLFALMHMINVGAWKPGSLALNPLAFSSFFWALGFAFLRRKTGSLVAPAFLHGVPQAIAWVFLGR